MRLIFHRQLAPQEEPKGLRNPPGDAKWLQDALSRPKEVEENVVENKEPAWGLFSIANLHARRSPKDPGTSQEMPKGSKMPLVAPKRSKKML